MRIKKMADGREIITTEDAEESQAKTRKASPRAGQGQGEAVAGSGIKRGGGNENRS